MEHYSPLKKKKEFLSHKNTIFQSQKMCLEIVLKKKNKNLPNKSSTFLI